MAGGMEIDPDSIARAGSDMLSAADRIHREVSTFQSELASYGEPWGADDLGSLIGMVYGVIEEIAMESYTGNAAEIEDIANGTRIMGANYAATEETNTDQVNKFRDALGG